MWQQEEMDKILRQADATEKTNKIKPTLSFNGREQPNQQHNPKPHPNTKLLRQQRKP